MKKQSWTRNEFRKLAGTGALLIGSLLIGLPDAMAQQTTNSPAKPADDTAANSDTSDLVNWIDIGAGGSVVTGDKAQFERQSGTLANRAMGGINALHLEQNIGKKGLISLDGRGIFDNHDYDLKLEVSHPEIGYVRAGLRQFREYYDGSGGFLPSNGAFFQLGNNELALDRGTMFFEAGLTLPDAPVFKIRYEHDFRSGAKDSTEWGTTTLTPGAAQKRITPSFYLIDEKTDSIALDATHTIKNTDFGLGVRYTWESVSDSHSTLMQPGEGANARTMTQGEQSKDEFFNAHAFTDTKINDLFEFTSGYEYTTLHSSLAGSRTDNPAVPATADTRFVNLAGGSDMDQYAMNLNLMFSPGENNYIVPALRVEKETLGGANTDNPLTTVGGVNTVGPQNSFQDQESKLNIAESLDWRYVGITNWVFYARGQWEENRSRLNQASGAVAIPPSILNQIWYQTMQKYSAGANWYPLRGLNFAASFYHEIDNNNYDNAIPAQPSPTYPGFIRQENFITDGTSVRGTWRVNSRLAFVSRYDFKYSTVDMQGGLAGGVAATPTQLIPIAYTTEHMFGETISLNPLARMYLEAGVNYVLDTTHTSAEAQTGGVIQKSQNDYWTFNLLAGYSFDDKTDIQIGYTYYRSADYSDNSAIGGVPYGAGGEENMVTVTLGRQIRRNLRGTLRYGYTSYRDQLFAGNIDYQAHTILGSLQYRF
jgi:hypothetical protein